MMNFIGLNVCIETDQNHLNTDKGFHKEVDRLEVEEVVIDL